MQQKAGASRAADWWPGRRENSLEQLCLGAWAAVHQPDRGHPHLLGGCRLPGGLYVQLQTGEGCLVPLPCFPPSSLPQLLVGLLVVIAIVGELGGIFSAFFYLNFSLMQEKANLNCLSLHILDIL